ncbi:MAG: hypothetical protein RL637_1767 [Pseudomonadota bacterium]|jgi:yecA family protein
MNHSELNRIFYHYSSDYSLSAAHGLASAFLCHPKSIHADQWLQEIFSDNELEITDQKLLMQWFEQIRTQFNPETHFAFDLYLPEDNQWSEQLSGLREWCEGFLTGIAEIPFTQSQTKTLYPLLHDLVEFTKIDEQIDAEDTEDNQQAFMEIHQYIRIVILTLYDELQLSPIK